MPMLLERMARGELKSAHLATHPLPLDEGPLGRCGVPYWLVTNELAELPGVLMGRRLPMTVSAVA